MRAFNVSLSRSPFFLALIFLAHVQALSFGGFVIETKDSVIDAKSFRIGAEFVEFTRLDGTEGTAAREYVDHIRDSSTDIESMGKREAIRIGGTTISKPILCFDSEARFAFFQDKDALSVKVFSANARVSFVTLYGSLAPDAKPDEDFSKNVLSKVRSLRSSRPSHTVALGKAFLLLGAGNKETRSKVEVEIEKANKRLDKRVSSLFKISSCKVRQTETGSGEPYEWLTYEFGSKLKHFEGLEFRIWVQLLNGDVGSASFSYKTVHPEKRHRDTVAIWTDAYKIGGAVERYRIQLSYSGRKAAEYHGGKSGKTDWWKSEPEFKLRSWDRDELGLQYSTNSLVRTDP